MSENPPGDLIVENAKTIPFSDAYGNIGHNTPLPCASNTPLRPKSTPKPAINMSQNAPVAPENQPILLAPENIYFTPPNAGNIEQPDYQKLYIKNLEDRVKFLEHVVKKQLQTIERLQISPTPPQQAPPSRPPAFSETIVTEPPPAPPPVTLSEQQKIQQSTQQPTSTQIPVQPPAQLPAQTPVQLTETPPVPGQQASQARRNAPPAAPTPPKEVLVLGDSITKDLNAYKMTKMARHKAKITTHSLSGCNTDEMDLLSRTLCLRKPDILILHCGTNDLFPKSGRDTEGTHYVAKTETQVVENLKNIVSSLQHEHPNMKILVSKLTTREDHGKEGVSKVNNTNTLISKSNLKTIDHSNITRKSLNGSKLHLSPDGTVEMARNIVNHIKKMC